MTARGNYRLVVFGPGIRKLDELISPQLYDHAPFTKAYRTLTMPGPTASAHQVLVYSGPGVSPLSLSHTILTLSLLLLPHYTVQPITPNTLATQPWEPACALLVIPGGRDLPYIDELTRKTRVTKRIREFVLEGGSFLGICAGAYFGSSRVEFDLGGDMEVKGDRELAFFPGVCEGPTFSGFQYAAESGSKAVNIVVGGAKPRSIDNLYYNGGGHFRLPETPSKDVEALATYGDTNQVAAVLTKNGKGKAVLCSVHFEYPLHDPPARDAIRKQEHPPSSEEIDHSEKERIEFAEDVLLLLGLKPPKRTEEAGHAVHGDEDPELLLHPTHPSPIFVFHHPNLPQLGSASFEPPALKAKLEQSDSEMVLRDGNDEIHVVSLDIVAAKGGAAGVAAHLASKRRSKPVFPPPVEQLSIEPSTTTPEPPQMPDLNALPKFILTPSDKVDYTPRWTPLFNFETYWQEIDSARKRVGRKSGVMRSGDRLALGDLVWYAEAITSTQTILDRNPLLLTSLPSPMVCMASFQLSGRGRGSNVWLSPPGCLQFSMLLTLPSSLSSKIVFIQYLAALAICDAVDEDGRLGVKIKWPNDLYAEVEGVGGSEVGGGKKGRAKIGGILVNTNFVGGQWRIVVGCGVNILNALPTTSVSQLHSLLSARTPMPTKPLPPPPTMESTFAKIMTSFEQKWDQFVEEKGFSGFLDEYYGRWLHANQEVTLTTVEPHQRLRIHSITPDHGLLRCVPLDNKPKASNGLTPLYSRGDYGDDDRVLTKSSGKKDDEWVDLQPDGNSFDLMAGLIKRKT